MKLAVVGGTGVVGRFTVEAARAAGHAVSVIARSTGVDLVTGAGLARALDGADAVIDTSNIVTLSAKPARAFFRAATENLLAAANTANVRHVVALSIVGIDDIDAGYYAGKLVQERLLAASDMPTTIVRAAQFHEFVGQIIGRGFGAFVPVPRTLMRPVAAREVGTYLVKTAEQVPVGRAPDLVGPRSEVLIDLVRRQLRTEPRRRIVFPVPLPGTFGRGLASGALRGTVDAAYGTTTFDDWLHSADHAHE